MRTLTVLLFIALAFGMVFDAPAQDSTITYQGQLRQAGGLFTGTTDLEFRLFDQSAGGSQVGIAQTRPNWPIEDGLFQVELDFGSEAFAEQVRYLEIHVNGTPLSPRQVIRPSPIALFALSGNKGPPGPPGPTGAAPFTLDPATGTIEYFTLDQRLRFEPDPNPLNGPRIMAGHVTNLAAGAGSVIAGGGRSNGANVSSSAWTTISGGFGNRALADEATVAGGGNNRAQGSGATVGGGRVNQADGELATIAGGQINQALGTLAVISGGSSNIAAELATIGGGADNLAAAASSTISGGRNNVSAGQFSAIGGGQRNRTGGAWSVVGGGIDQHASGVLSAVLGGQDNIAGGGHASVAGGDANRADGEYGFIGGGRLNLVSDVSKHAVIGGGLQNQGFGFASSIGGGQQNAASGAAATVAGGSANVAAGNFAFIGGGENNQADGAWAVAPGGFGNRAAGLASFAAGSQARAVSDGSFVWSDTSSAASFASTGGNQFLLRATGGVGINTNAPQRQLHVRQQSTNNNTSGITIQRNGSADQWGLYVSSTNHFVFVANNAARGSINPDTGQFSALSDRRAKRDIEPLDGVLDRFLRLRPSRYRMAHQENHEADSVGLIAQEVELLFPEVVSQMDGGQLGLRYADITVLNAQALIELHRLHDNRISQLEHENNALRMQVSALQARTDRSVELEFRLAALEALLFAGRSVTESQQERSESTKF